ncbi:hypothetical protein [Mameliella sediminis]|uniref:hypothetical protein n=1 Tax=Mameliella sediminis TaxID=2836866 RepID=UPI001C48EC87|nr:hypothetical protein [Mameliella sediminis]MBY6113937.1 hypothetical protein [Antarctobacter heliothermus]MBY6142715.1 hypothetical protein [Mameliella alba]MBV7395234.1 hypothetical protein [Mameliella sediminis]MBY6159570.1 hypothetical protein [Mameliella alba]MBY6168041.1 hypothetical protein [Mameliella alba]
MKITRIVALALGLVTLALASCTTVSASFDQTDIDALSARIRALGPEVDPGEAQRAARIAFQYSVQLKQEYEVTDPPLIHNAKVHNGERQRGLCNHWAEDLHRRLSQENFRTLSIQRAISPRTPFRIIHHSAVVTKRGDTIYDGVILDPWRNGGKLHWEGTRADDKYNWRPRQEVLKEMIAARKLRDAREN